MQQMYHQTGRAYHRGGVLSIFPGKKVQARGKCAIMGNMERNTFVKSQIADAMLLLLKEKPFSGITIREITSIAQVSRNSFYRNYTDKEDIIKQHLHSLLQNWSDASVPDENDGTKLYAGLFVHLEKNKDLFLLLKQQGLFHLFMDVFLECYGVKPEYDNASAYATSFISYGIYGWISEWIARGMQEPAEMVAELLAAQNSRS